MTLTLALSPVDSFARAFLRLLAPFERPDGRAVRRIEFARSNCKTGSKRTTSFRPFRGVVPTTERRP
ncbi:hypothetical protein ZOD2009_11945 [Haladaptatus paucihalophilus DX253]|uniref:Uncharacterized protein n=1 Tax=Haladaptatus paucihalophilus DX253 TaxID=797209 RepID=E7QUA9_HALPU|nr:hypothetical protein ZOD2009_11945 [Haladaptatus paucihalophilus DX253]